MEQIRRIEKSRPVRAVYRCDCGTEFEAFASNVTTGKTKSCGCLRSQMAKEKMAQHHDKFVGNRLTHGRRRSLEWSSWQAMIQRCINQNRSNYPYYGGRGIAVCDRWRHSFEAFFADMGKRPAGTQIERIDNDGHYELGNCRWATRKEQANNRRPRGSQHRPS